MRIWLFRLIAIALPCLVLLLLEGTLRVAGIGQQYPLFIRNPANPAYLVTEPNIIQRYFASQQNVPSVQLEPAFLLADKPANSIRLVVQGGSTAAGYPYGVGASLAGMLEQRLRRTFPATDIEVVNTALSAVNSYTLLDLADDIIAQHPDAVLIYAGHNEYLGILGVGSNYVAAESPLITRLLLKLQKLYLYQAIAKVFSPLQTTVPPSDSNQTQKRTFMAQVAKQKNISSGSALYYAGLTQFEQNMQLLLQKYQAAGIAVYISTIASNIADQAPFNSPPLSTEQQRQLQSLQHQLQSGAALSQLSAPLNALQQEADSSQHALLHFQLGQLFRQYGDIAAAKHHLTAAKDADLLRFRAPEAINDAIRQLASQTGAVLVDTQANWQQHSPDGLIGKALMLEHLHPNARGYYWLADSFYQVLHQRNAFFTWQGTVPEAISWAERPLLPAEEYAGTLRILQLTADYPFQTTPQPMQWPTANNLPEKLALDYVKGHIDWLGMMQQSARYYQQQRDGDLLLKSLTILADALPHDANTNLQAAKILLQATRRDEALHYLQRSLRNAQPPAEAQALQQQLLKKR